MLSLKGLKTKSSAVKLYFCDFNISGRLYKVKSDINKNKILYSNGFDIDKVL